MITPKLWVPPKVAGEYLNTFDRHGVANVVSGAWDMVSEDNKILWRLGQQLLDRHQMPTPELPDPKISALAIKLGFATGFMALHCYTKVKVPTVGPVAVDNVHRNMLFPELDTAYEAAMETDRGYSDVITDVAQKTAAETKLPVEQLVKIGGGCLFIYCNEQYQIQESAKYN